MKRTAVIVMQKDTECVLAVCERAAAETPQGAAEKELLLKELVGTGIVVDDAAGKLSAIVPVEQLALEVVATSEVAAALRDPMAYHLKRDQGSTQLDLELSNRKTGSSVDVTNPNSGSLFKVTVSLAPTKKVPAWLSVRGVNGQYDSTAEMDTTKTVTFNTGLPTGDYLAIAAVVGSAGCVKKLNVQ